MSINFFKTSSLGLIFILCGCNSLHFYDESASKMASDAKTSYAESKIIDALKVERENFETIGKNEEKAYLRIENANRDLTLLSILKSEDFFNSFDDYFFKKMSLMIIKPNKNICIENDKNCIDKYNIDQYDNFKTKITRFNNTIIEFDKLKNIEKAQRSTLSNLPLKIKKIDFKKLVEDDLPQCIPLHKDKFIVVENGKPVLKNGEPVLKNTFSSLAEAFGDEQFTKLAKDNMLSENSKEFIEEEYNHYVTSCSKLLANSPKYPGELIEKIKSKFKEEADNLYLVEQEVKKEKVNLKHVIDELKKAKESEKQDIDFSCQKKTENKTKVEVDKNVAGDQTGSEKNNSSGAGTSDNLAKKLCDALAKLEESDLGKKIISEEKIERINDLMESLHGENNTRTENKTSNTNQSDQNKADKDEKIKTGLALLGASARFAGALKQYNAAGTLPSLEKLLIEKQLAAAQLAYSTQGYELQKQRVAREEEKLKAYILEGNLLIQAKAELDNIRYLDNCKSQGSGVSDSCVSMSDLLSEQKYQQPTQKSSEPPMRHAYRALALLAESFSVARSSYLSADLKLAQLSYADSFNRSEAAVAAWDALISTPLAQLETFHKRGIKSGEMANLIFQGLQAAGVIGIAVK